MKIYNSVGCTMEGICDSELSKFLDNGWMSEEDYYKLHPEEKE